MKLKKSPLDLTFIMSLLTKAKDFSSGVVAPEAKLG